MSDTVTGTHAAETYGATSTEELKPCPFCGYEKIEIKQYRKDGLKIQCKGCAIRKQQRTIYYSLDWLRDKMTEHWNTRANEWQPIKTLTPEETLVLIVSKSYLGWVTMAKWFKYNGKAAWRDSENDIILDATHWMPLPDPPKN